MSKHPFVVSPDSYTCYVCGAPMSDDSHTLDIRDYDTGKLCGAPTARGLNQTTASGRPFWSADPREEDVRIYDIAAQLSRICRYNGALREEVEIYSVAQHCVLVSDHCPDELRLEGLLHDAAEAYVGDMTKPVKSLFPNRNEVEDRIEAVVRRKYGLPPTLSAEVKRADYYAVATERRDLCTNLGLVDWGPMPAPWLETIRPWSPRIARIMFLKTFDTLTRGRFNNGSEAYT